MQLDESRLHRWLAIRLVFAISVIAFLLEQLSIRLD